MNRAVARRARSTGGRRGFTLIETVFSLLIVGVLVGAVLGATRTIADARLVRHEQRIATGLAAELAAEALASPFGADASATESGGLVSAVVGTVGDVVGGLLGGLLGGGGGGGGPPPPSRRSQIDELNDYAAWEESPPRARDGSALPGLAGWQRAVTVQNGIVLGSISAADPHAKTITVFVVSPRGARTQWSIVRTKDADPAGDPDTAVAAVLAGIEVGDAPERLRTGVHLINRPPADGS